MRFTPTTFSTTVCFIIFYGVPVSFNVLGFILFYMEIRSQYFLGLNGIVAKGKSYFSTPNNLNMKIGQELVGGLNTLKPAVYIGLCLFIQTFVQIN